MFGQDEYPQCETEDLGMGKENSIEERVEGYKGNADT